MPGIYVLRAEPEFNLTMGGLAISYLRLRRKEKERGSQRAHYTSLLFTCAILDVPCLHVITQHVFNSF
ncbi:Uncharacterized protein HZ326_13815 [Fusarium oxysporum f. sp. albedinis]|nr:Uncharacterized protein HZ326_13815 [Fusarium oxysporum f. sp. albedinis]